MVYDGKRLASIIEHPYSNMERLFMAVFLNKNLPLTEGGGSTEKILYRIYKKDSESINYIRNVKAQNDLEEALLFVTTGKRTERLEQILTNPPSNIIKYILSTMGWYDKRKLPKPQSDLELILAYVLGFVEPEYPLPDYGEETLRWYMDMRVPLNEGEKAEMTPESDTVVSNALKIDPTKKYAFKLESRLKKACWFVPCDKTNVILNDPIYLQTGTFYSLKFGSDVNHGYILLMNFSKSGVVLDDSYFRVEL